MNGPSENSGSWFVVSRNKLTAILLIFFIVSVSVDKLVSLTILGNINVSLQTVSLLVGFLYFFLLFISLRKFSNRLNYQILMFMLLLLLLYFCIEAFRSLAEIKAVTYLILLFLNMFVFYFFSQKIDTEVVKYSNKWIFYLGVLFLAAAFFTYLYVLIFQAKMILLNRELWDVGSNGVYEVLFGRYIAFQGYAGDPNVVGTAVAAVLFCGIYIASVNKSKLLFFINIFLIIILFSSFSRGSIIGLLITLFFCGFVLKKREYRKYFFILIGMFSLGFMLATFLNNAGFESFNPFNKFTQSIDRRESEWELVFKLWLESPMLGGGLRFDEIKLGKYTENSYLGLLVNVGIVGLFVYLSILGVSFFCAIKIWLINKNEEIFPWIAYGMYLFVSMGFISMEVKPHVWVTFSVLASYAFMNRAKWCRNFLICRRAHGS